jgi:hypothetical protein
VIPGRDKFPRLPQYQVTGSSLKTVDPSTMSENYGFDFAAYDWAGRPFLSSRFENLPCCWTAEQAFLTDPLSYADLDEFVGDRVKVAPTPRLGQAGSLFRLPRVIVMHILPSFLTDMPAHRAVNNLREELEANRILALEVPSQLSDAPFQLIWWSLLHGGFNVVSDFGGDFYTLDVDESKSVGGEVLFLETDVAGGPTFMPYRNCLFATNLTALLAAEQDIAERTQPRFANVRYFHQVAFAETYAAADISWLESLPGQFPDGFLEVAAVDGDTSGTVMDPEPAELLEATALVEEQIREFFDF